MWWEDVENVENLIKLTRVLSPPQIFRSENERNERDDHGRKIFFIIRRRFFTFSSRAHEKFFTSLHFFHLLLCDSLARDLFLLQTGIDFQCILCRLTAKMC